MKRNYNQINIMSTITPGHDSQPLMYHTHFSVLIRDPADILLATGSGDILAPKPRAPGSGPIRVVHGTTRG